MLLMMTMMMVIMMMMCCRCDAEEKSDVFDSSTQLTIATVLYVLQRLL